MEQSIEQRVADLEKATALLMAALPVWMGYTDAERKWLDEWYARVRRDAGIESKGLRDRCPATSVRPAAAR